MNNVIKIACFLSLLTNCLQAQKHDYNWVFGSGQINRPDSAYYIMHLEFEHNEPIIVPNFLRTIHMDNMNVSTCDREGNLLFYTNGIKLENAQGEVLADCMNPGIWQELYKEHNIGYPMASSIVSLPLDTVDEEFSLVHISFTVKDNQLNFEQNLNTRLSFKNNPMGELLYINDTLRMGNAGLFMNAVKHANGLDWWVVNINLFEGSNCYFVDYHSLDTIILGKECLGYERSIRDDGGQGFFSQDGSMFATSSVVGDAVLFDFDRCTGLFSNPKHLQIYDSADTLSPFAGGAFSPSGQFLYIGNKHNLYQYDLWSDNIEDSRIQLAQMGPEFPDTRPLHLAQLAPDGKIYWDLTHYFGRDLTVIHEPDRKGVDCLLEFGGLPLPYINGTMPQFPNYRLGPLDGSPCDTLGIHNHPVAEFRWYDQGQLEVDFRNLSHHEPEDYHWDFGNGSSSSLFRPVYTFADTGLYNVCLTVSNAYGSDTFCRDVYLKDLTTSTNEEESIFPIKIFPNPTSDFVQIAFPEIGHYKICLYDLNGRKLQDHSSSALNYIMDVSGLSSGIYQLVIHEDLSILFEERLIIR